MLVIIEKNKNLFFDGEVFLISLEICLIEFFVGFIDNWVELFLDLLLLEKFLWIIILF